MASTFVSAPGLAPASRPIFDPHHPNLAANDEDFIHGELAALAAEWADTPGAASSANLSRSQPSDLEDVDVDLYGDLFFGTDFPNASSAEPSFPGVRLDSQEQLLQHQSSRDEATQVQTTSQAAQSTETISSPRRPLVFDQALSYPLTPTQTASVHATTPRSELRDPAWRPFSDPPTLCVSPDQLQHPFESASISAQPNRTFPGDSSNEGIPTLAFAAAKLDSPSPRFTVSVWDGQDGPQARPVERSLDEGAGSAHEDAPSAGDLIFAGDGSSSHFISSASNSRRPPPADSVAPRQGLEPEARGSEEAPISITEIAADQSVQERNQVVAKWLAEGTHTAPPPPDNAAQDSLAAEQLQALHDDDDQIPLGHQTENRLLPGQTYYNEQGPGPMTQVDRDIIAADQRWADAPMLPNISAGVPGLRQPQSSQAALKRFEDMCRENDTISRCATWGTRRRSLPAVGDLSHDSGPAGGFLKKLSMGRGGTDKSGRTANLLKDIRGLVRGPSVSSMRKRSRSRSQSGRDDDASPQQPDGELTGGKRETTTLLSPPPGTPGSGGMKSAPSINTALASMAHNLVSLSMSRSRSGSANATTPASPATPVTSPKTSLGVRNPLRRPRSKSEMSKVPSATSKPTGSHPHLVDMWKRSGGPPVASLGKSNGSHGGDEEYQDDDDDDDDDHHDLGDESDDKASQAASTSINDVPPTFQGFRQHILALNPGLDESHGYLVDRIAQQQVARYKLLLTARVRHLGLGTACASGALCEARKGESLTALAVAKGKGGTKKRNDVDRSRLPLCDDDEDDDVAAALPDGTVTHESFPRDIPMPPRQRLPAEFECQLCFQRKTFQKPSDWTKHVHEDVQPFTCTWDMCRDPKVFKRKADWVRHENEGHRHLEWWTCDVDDCRHTCYRRDNFLQHLVREHKFAEPRVKIKAALRRAGPTDPTWRKVEECHVETSARPQEEPCRFCGKVLPTWKKLTVHLTKHMEQITLPLLRLVAAAELDADSILSPVQDARTLVMSTGTGTSTAAMSRYSSSSSQPALVAIRGYSGMSGQLQQQPQQQQQQVQRQCTMAGRGQPSTYAVLPTSTTVTPMTAGQTGDLRAGYYAPRRHQGLSSETSGGPGNSYGMTTGVSAVAAGMEASSDGIYGSSGGGGSNSGLEPFPQLDESSFLISGEGTLMGVQGASGGPSMTGPLTTATAMRFGNSPMAEAQMETRMNMGIAPAQYCFDDGTTTAAMMGASSGAGQGLVGGQGSLGAWTRSWPRQNEW